jgi:hypothetical protein
MLTRVSVANRGASILPRATLVYMLVVLCFPLLALSQSIADLNGHWTVVWLRNTAYARNALALTSSGDSLSGTYIDDAGDSCSVSGVFAAAGSAAGSTVTLHVACPNWSIRMQGVVALNGKMVKGDYQTGQVVGEFQMEK